jgi:CysZ protein
MSVTASPEQRPELGRLVPRALADVFGGTLSGIATLAILAALVLLGGAIAAAIIWLVPMAPIPADWPVWGRGAAEIALSVAPFLMALLLIAPVSMVVGATLFDVAAERVERAAGGTAGMGKGLDPVRGLVTGLRFAAVSVPLTLLSLPLIFFGGIGLVLIVLINAFLFSREYFSLAALRHGGWEEARALRRRHGGLVFGAGAAMALVAIIPLVQLVTPLFGCALMVRLHRALRGPASASL